MLITAFVLKLDNAFKANTVVICGQAGASRKGFLELSSFPFHFSVPCFMYIVFHDVA